MLHSEPFFQHATLKNWEKAWAVGYEATLAHVISCISCVYTTKRDDILIDLGIKRTLHEYYHGRKKQ